MLKIQFKVKAETEPAEEIKIVGSLPELGQWNPQKGLKLDRTSYGEWESYEPIEIDENVKFQFKLVKFRANNQIEWEKLLNNSNRKFKPRFNSKLIINWSLAEGKVVNESRRSYKIKGLPGALIKNTKVEKRSSIFDPYKKAMHSDSENEEEDNFSFLQKRAVLDPRQKINTGDIEDMYYDTTAVELAVGQPKKQKIYLFSQNLNFQQAFDLKVQQEAQKIQDFYFTWFYCQTKTELPNIKRIQFQQIPQGMLKSYEKLNSDFLEKNTLFIFLDLFMTTKIDVIDLKACLYLKGDQYQEVEQQLFFLQKFKFIAFENPDKNQQFFELLTARRSQREIEQSDSQASSIPLGQDNNKLISKVCLQGIIDQLRLDQFGRSVKVNTVYSVSEREALNQIIQPNSVMIVDCHLKETDNSFFEKLITEQVKNRMIIIVAPDCCPEPIKQYIPRKDIVIISGNFQKIRMKEKVHQPIRKHKELIEMLKMKVNLTQETYGGEWSFTEGSVFYKNEEKPELLKKIQQQLKTIIKDRNYFRTNIKKDRIKVSWCLAPKIRLIRTLCRIKYLSEGKIGNFHLVSVNQDFSELKDQIKLFVQLRSVFLEGGTSSKVENYSYGTKVPAKYTIIPDEAKNLKPVDMNIS